MKPGIAAEMLTVYLTKGVQATTAIEGNTLTEIQVRQRVEKLLELPESREYLGTEIDNVLEALQQVMTHLYNRFDTEVRVSDIVSANEMVLRGLTVESPTVPGQLRVHSVTVGNYLGAPAEDCEYLLNELCAWLNRPWHVDPKDRIIFGILKAIVAHLYLAWIHPFGDGNGRTARLIEYQILTTCGVPDVAAHVLTNHYNLTRSEYYRQLDLASKSGGDVVPFLLYAVRGFVDGLQEQLGTIRGQQLQLAWRDFIHELLPDSGGKATIRQRHLVLSLDPSQPASISDLRKKNARVAGEYAKLTKHTLQRDIEKLVEMGLIKKELTKDGPSIRANLEQVFAFQPNRAPADEPSLDL